jgi:hypothetical protein
MDSWLTRSRGQPKTGFPSGSILPIFSPCPPSKGNSDSSIDASGASSGAKGFLDRLTAPIPKVDAISFLTGQVYTPSSALYQGISYLGSGLLLKFLADGGGGQYVSGNTKSWQQIRETLAPKSNPEPFSLELTVSPPPAKPFDTYEIGPAPADADKPRFFIGSAAPGDSVILSLKARFKGLDSTFIRTVSFPVMEDSSLFGNALEVVLAGESIQRLFQGALLDTVKLVALALKNRIVTDYTALLALEPNDTLHFMRDPHDESVIGAPTTALAGGKPGQDSLGITAVFSASEKRWHYAVSVPAGGEVELCIYDLMGRKTFELSQEVGSKGIYAFLGRQINGSANPADRFSVAFLKFSPASPESGEKPLVKIARFMR